MFGQHYYRHGETFSINYREKIRYRIITISAAEVPVKFQSQWRSLNPNVAASKLHEIWQLLLRLLPPLYKPVVNTSMAELLVVMN